MVSNVNIRFQDALEKTRGMSIAHIEAKAEEYVYKKDAPEGGIYASFRDAPLSL